MIGVIVAFRNEIDRYLKSAGLQVVDEEGGLRFHGTAVADDVVVVEGGIGKRGAQEASERLLQRYPVDLVISAGFAGGVTSGLQPGDLYLCDSLMAVEGPAAVWEPETVLRKPVAVDLGVAERLRGRGIRFDVGPCLSVPHLIPTTSMKRWIGETFPTSIIDMESYWVVEAVAARGIPVGVARCVLDTVDQTLPSFVGGVVNDGKGHGLDRALKYIARRPAEVPRLVRLAGQAKTAGESLSVLLSSLIYCLTAQPLTTGQARL